MNKIGLFILVGSLSGVPLSYLFQSEVVRSKVGGFWGYFENFRRVVHEPALLGNILLAIGLFAFVGGVVGYAIEQYETHKKARH